MWAGHGIHHCEIFVFLSPGRTTNCKGKSVYLLAALAKLPGAGNEPKHPISVA
jgi:hypothetical protein